ncbi:unnamed protein product [Pipistrellus nathusii]|uniref:Uncharacterized protein n=1 Tax=Pipistrellus nathusii TaxID=59473 RepID=A0ABP0AB52_PIPNA
MGASHFHQNVVSKVTQQLWRFPMAVPHWCLYFHTSKAQPPLTGCKNTSETTQRKHRKGSCVTREERDLRVTLAGELTHTRVCTWHMHKRSTERTGSHSG